MRTINVDALVEALTVQAERYAKEARDEKNVHLVTYYGSIQIAIQAVQIAIMQSVVTK
jgi:hypothetical protein